MNKLKTFPTPVLLLAFILATTGPLKASQPHSMTGRTTEALVSTQWLEDNLEDPDLVVLDIRDPESYNAGHITGSVNVPAPGNFFECFMNPDCGLWMELPEDAKLFKTIGNAGITAKSSVVLICGTSNSPSVETAYYGLTLAARAAITLIYAGIDNVSILNGGYTKWTMEGRTTSTEPVAPDPVKYDGIIRKDMFVLKDYVADKMGKSILVDARTADIYFGVEEDMSASRDGHIPMSKVLPAPWLWAPEENENAESAWLDWKGAEQLSEMARAAVGDDKDEEVIVYCGVGGFASPVYFILTELLGFTNVKFYDGSMQEWTADPDAPVVKYKYE